MATDSEFTLDKDKDHQPIVDAYWENGYVVIRNLLAKDELDNINTELFDHDDLINHTYSIPDGAGTRPKLILWNYAGSDVTGMVARSEKISTLCEKILKDEVYHYHSKLILKEANTGGKWNWHQDYGYWYDNGCLSADGLVTVWIALDRADKGNGGLEIIPKSHKLGRINHNVFDGQSQAEPERLKHIRERFPSLYPELNPGDALIFHSNVLHTSNQNKSDRRRYALLICYNTKGNNPTKEHHHALYNPLQKVPDSAIAACRNYTDFSDKDMRDFSTLYDRTKCQVDDQTGHETRRTTWERVLLRE